MQMKKVKVSIILILVVVMISTIVRSAETAKAEITAPAEVKVGKTFSVTVPVTGDGNGINGLQGTLKYDKSVLELSDKNATDGWMISGYNEDTGVFLAEIVNLTDSDSYIKDKTDLVTFEFKVKDNAELGETEVKLTNLIASGSAGLESTEVAKLVNVVGENANTNTTNNTTNNVVNNKTTNNTIVINNTNTTNKNNTTNNTVKTLNNTTDNIANKKIPYAGEESLILKSIFVLACIAIIFYVKIKRYEDVI